MKRKRKDGIGTTKNQTHSITVNKVIMAAVNNFEVITETNLTT